MIILLHRVRSSRHRQRTSVVSSLNWWRSMGKGKEPKKYRAHTKLARRKAWNKQNDQKSELHVRTLQVHIYQVPPAYMSLVEMWAKYFFASVDYRIPGVACQYFQMCSLVMYRGHNRSTTVFLGSPPPAAVGERCSRFCMLR